MLYVHSVSVPYLDMCKGVPGVSQLTFQEWGASAVVFWQDFLRHWVCTWDQVLPDWPFPTL